MAGTFTWTGMSAGEPAGERVFGPITIQGAVVIGDTYSGPLASGDNTIPVPLGALAVTIITPQNNTAVLKLRTSINPLDSGISLNPGGLPTVYPFPATPPTSIILNAASAVNAFTSVIFI